MFQWQNTSKEHTYSFLRNSSFLLVLYCCPFLGNFHLDSQNYSELLYYHLI